MRSEATDCVGHAGRDDGAAGDAEIAFLRRGVARAGLASDSGTRQSGGTRAVPPMRWQKLQFACR